MTFGIFSLSGVGHLNPFCALARELAGRGHDIVFFHVPDVAPEIRRRGFRCEEYGTRTCPPGTLVARREALRSLSGLDVMRAYLDILRSQSEALFAEGRAVIEAARVDLWLVDHFDYAAATLAAHLRAPFVTVIVGLMRHQEEGVPGFGGETYSTDPAVLERDRLAHDAILATSRPFRDFIGAYRQQAGLGAFCYDTLWSSLAQITQQPAEFEFPRRRLPDCFHFTGPFIRRDLRDPVDFPWHQLDGRPLVYASFGTLLTRHSSLYQLIAEAVDGLDVQLVFSMGGTAADPPANLPGDPVVVPFAPQLDVLDKAALTITPAGMNTTLESLSAGVPIVAIPMANDQPGISARIEWTGTGLRIPAAACDPIRLRQAVRTVLHDDSFRRAACRFQQIIRDAGGLCRAATLIEKVAATGKPVLRG